MKTLLEAFGGFNGKFLHWWDQGGLITNVPWKPAQPANDYEQYLKAVSSDVLDRLLFQEYGDRPITRWVESMLGIDGKVTELDAQILASNVLQIFYVSWMRLFEDYSSEYNPVENYSMEEGGTDSTNKKGANASTTGTADATLTHSTEGTDASASIGTLEDYEITNTPAQGNTLQQAATYDSDLKDRVKETYTNTTPGSTKENGKRGAANNYEDNEVRNHTFNRHGNIGVMTATQMIENDSEFWSANDFFSRILADVASIITVPIYE